uniref:Uncharacterized protein n=1 Tax=Rhizophora mucronata TaxID=61149 RepID=A0A2P2QUM3_RHIMU
MLQVPVHQKGQKHV